MYVCISNIDRMIVGIMFGGVGRGNEAWAIALFGVLMENDDDDE